MEQCKTTIVFLGRPMECEKKHGHNGRHSSSWHPDNVDAEVLWNGGYTPEPKTALSPLERAWEENWPSCHASFGAGWFTAEQAESFRMICKSEFVAGWKAFASHMEAGTTFKYDPTDSVGSGALK